MTVKLSVGTIVPKGTTLWTPDLYICINRDNALSDFIHASLARMQSHPELSNSLMSTCLISNQQHLSFIWSKCQFVDFMQPITTSRPSFRTFINLGHDMSLHRVTQRESRNECADPSSPMDIDLNAGIGVTRSTTCMPGFIPVAGNKSE